jgi:hypothetical protein
MQLVEFIHKIHPAEHKILYGRHYEEDNMDEYPGKHFVHISWLEQILHLGISNKQLMQVEENCVEFKRYPIEHLEHNDF